MNTFLEVPLKQTQLDKNKKPVVKTVDTIFIKRIKRKDLNAFIDFQDKLLQQFIENNLSVASIASDEGHGMKIMREMAALIPVVTEGESKTLDLDYLLDEDVNEDWLPTITRLFFTQSIDDDDFSDINAPYRPSLISEFNQLDFGGSWGKAKAEVLKSLESQMNQEES